MPRPSMAYIAPQPVEPLNMVEVRFWLEIMRDHAVFIKSGLPCDRKDLIEEAQNFYREFSTLLNRLEKVQSEKKFHELVCTAYDSVKEFHRYKHHLLRLKISCKLGGYNFPLFFDHVAREAEYVMRLFGKMREGRPVLKAAAKTQETAFWVRIMGDHAKFTSHLLDPSEYSLISTANEFSLDFDELFLQSKDFVSMLHHSGSEVPSFRRFLQDVQASTKELRDFKRAVQDMIAQCKLLGLIPEALADHIRREAEHFLMILSLMEKGVIKNAPDCAEDDLEAIEDAEYMDDDIDVDEPFCSPADTPGEDDSEECECDEDDYDDYDEDDCDDEEYEKPIIKPTKYDMPKLQTAGLDFDDDDEYYDDNDDRENKDVKNLPSESASTLEVEPVKQSAPKYKWGGTWPRPLGKKE